MEPRKMAKHRRRLWNMIKKAVRQTIIDRPRRREEPEKGRLITSDVDRILNRTEQNIEMLLPSMPELKTLGNYRLVFGTLVGLALYRALRAEGMSKSYAIELFNDVAWKTYKINPMLRFLRIILKLAARDPFKQMGIRLNLMLRWYYTPPAYDIKFSSDPNTKTYRVDVYRCPLFEFVRTLDDKEALEWFRNTLCVHDFTSAEHMAKGGRHERQHNLADGDNLCDQRWIVADDKNKASGLLTTLL